ncbi:MAG: hypothetical protein ETSY2_01390 [Candidatus Entotheonella gemina]|uniref:histidine kinase n=1 Tax=Candidatus Entotheonella gemina TaxID=1429439 RepID=W4MFK6_9BACT|nr:MAG: hypothetical protein ETSY2_01390 [Candidatus Entotheonella gemina]
MSFIRSRPSLRHVLPLLFLLLAALPAGAIGILLSQHAWDREFRAVREQHLQLALTLSDTLTRYATDVSAHLQLLVSHLEENRSVTTLIPLLDRLHFQVAAVVHRHGGIEHLVAVSRDRQAQFPETFFNTLTQRPSAPLSPSAPSTHPVFSPVQHDEHGNPILFLSYPLGPDRYAVGVLSTTFFIEQQQKIHFGEKGHAAIVDHLGRILAHPDPGWTKEARDLSQLEPIRRLLAGETDVTQFFSPKVRADMITGFSPVLLTGWGVMVPQPMAELQAHVRQGRRTIWLVIAIALFCSALLGLVVSHWLAAPLRRIGMVATHFANGVQAARVAPLGPLHPQETAQVASQFNAMADHVTQSWKAQHRSEERFRNFAEIAADWFWETDLQHVFTYISPAPKHHGNWRFDALLGQRWSDHIEPGINDPMLAHLQTYMDGAEAFEDIVFVIDRPDEQPIHISVAGKPMYDHSGALTGYRGVTRDITARLQAETQLLQAQQAEERRQSQKMEAIGTLAGGIAHDFNNILSVILGFSELTLYEVAKGSVAWHNLQQVMTASRRAKELVRQILTFSRKNGQERQPVQLQVVVHEAMKLLRASLPATIRIRQDISEQAGTILADPTQMQQVLMNLCLNSAYAMQRSGGLLEVCLDAVEINKEPYVRLTVKDNGEGIPEEALERIFEPFFTTKTASEGTGMGLAVVHGIVTSHGGTITVDSRPGQGAKFEVCLSQLGRAELAEAVPQGPPPKGKERILFVDDEAPLTRLAERTLERLGYTVVAITSSLEALETFRKSPEAFDLVITDQTMPHMTGDVLARELRHIRADIPIILCTGYSHMIDADEATAQGINAFLHKPLLANDLAKAIQQVCRPSEPVW